MSTTSSTVATLVGDVAEAPAKLHAKKPSIHSTVPIQTNSPNCRSVLSLTTTPLRPSLKRSVTSGSQRRSIPSKVHVDTRAFSGQPALDTPRSFQQLYDEQAYLMASRVMEEQRSRELMRRLATLQENLDGECPSSQSRKSKKQSSLLKAKLLRAAEQEKAIMGRLGEVFVEVQTRQRWMQAQQERHVTSSWTPTPWAVWETVASPISGLMTPIVLTPTCAPLVVPEPLVGAQLDAKSPEFVPGVPFLFPTNGPGQQGYGCTSEADCDVSPLAMLGTDGLNLESFGKADLESLGTADLGDALGNRGLEFEFQGVETPGETEPTLQKAKACRGGRERRMSLPGLRCVWPGSGVQGTFEDNEWNTQHRPEQPHHVEDVEL